ncbi:MAG: sensor histidine kinase [Calditrichaeota bacterium]|nr:MAG: sensor histidine kinase [Calditrichota bacterium]
MQANSPGSHSERLPFLTASILNDRIAWSIRLRWLALTGFGVVTFFVRLEGFEHVYISIYYTLAFLGGINLFYYIVYRFKDDFSIRDEFIFLTIHIVLDVIILTMLIHFAGGIENPLYFFYIFHVIISSILFPGRWPYLFTSFVFVLFLLLVMGEFYQFIPHYCIYQSGFHDNPLLNGLIIAIFTTTIFLTTYIGTGFMRLFRGSQNEIQKLNRQLMANEQERLRFYRFTSHELKTPVVAIKTGIDTVLNSFGSDLPQQAVHLLQRASHRAGQMLEMLKELLELARFPEQNSLQERKPFDLRALLHRLVDSFRETATARGVHMDVHMPEDPVIISAVEKDIQTVFNNLISNAIRYNKKDGRVVIVLSHTSDGVTVEVSDTGIGIPVEQQNKIFEPFFRTAEAKQHVSDGTGLGLSLTRQIIEKSGGAIYVDSRPGEGTRFKVFLPGGN